MPTGPIWTWTDAEKEEYRRQNQLGEFAPGANTQVAPDISQEVTDLFTDTSVPEIDPQTLIDSNPMVIQPDFPTIEENVNAQINNEVIEQPSATSDFQYGVSDVVPDNYLDNVQTVVPDFASVNQPVPEDAVVKINPELDNYAQALQDTGATSESIMAEVGGNGVTSGLALGQAIADNGGITYTSEDLYTTQVVSPDQQISNSLDNDNRINSQIGSNMNARADELNYGSVQADFDNEGNIVPGTDVPLSQMDNPISIQPEQLFPEAFEAVNNIQPRKTVGFREIPGAQVPAQDIGSPPQNNIPLPSATSGSEPNVSVQTAGQQMDDNRWNQTTGSYSNPYAGTEAEADYTSSGSVLQQHADNYVTGGVPAEAEQHILQQQAQQNNNNVQFAGARAFSVGGFVDPIPEYRGRGGRV